MHTKISKYLLYLCLFSIAIGPLGAIPLGIEQVNIYFTDVITGLIALYWITNIRQAIKLIRTDSVAKYFCIFLGIATISLISSPLYLNIGEKIISGLYLVRLIAYFFVYLTSRKLIKDKIISTEVIIRLMMVIGLILAGLGWLQYFLYPDLRNLYYLGWDPHLKRIFSTFLDPNYFGLMMVLTLILLFELVENYYSKTSRFTEFILSEVEGLSRRIISIGLLIFIFLTLMFTYSRSSFMAFFAAIAYLSIIVKKIKIIMVIIIIFVLSAILLPRPGGVGVQLERVFSIETRIDNWQQAFNIFADHPLLGVGFNTVRFAKREYNYVQDNLSTNHAGAGFDNSFLFIAATTGILGLVSYLIFLYKIFQRTDIWVRTSLITIIIHSLFLNSFFFPWVMLWMWVIVAIGVNHSGAAKFQRDPSG